MIRSLGMKKPEINPEVFIAPSAEIIGRVIIDKGSSIWYNAVIRADLQEVRIGQHSNIQDGCTVHVDDQYPVVIGDYTTIGHNAVIHGCTIGNRVLIGMGAVVLNGAVIHDGAVVAAGAVIKEKTVVEANSLYAGVPAKQIKVMDHDSQELREQHANNYEQLWRDFYRN